MISLTEATPIFKSIALQITGYKTAVQGGNEISILYKIPKVQNPEKIYLEFPQNSNRTS